MGLPDPTPPSHAEAPPSASALRRRTSRPMARPEPAKLLPPTPPSGQLNGVPRELLVPLTRLRPGQRAIIAQLDSVDPIGRRLLDLGFVPGSEVRAVRRAPLGDPVAYEVRGSQLCLRARDARQVWVRILDSDGG
jgi:ferrous iron transport protein A